MIKSKDFKKYKNRNNENDLERAKYVIPHIKIRPGRALENGIHLFGVTVRCWTEMD